MGYSGDQPPNRRKFDANGNLIDPEDIAKNPEIWEYLLEGSDPTNPLALQRVLTEADKHARMRASHGGFVLDPVRYVELIESEAYQNAAAQLVEEQKAYPELMFADSNSVSVPYKQPVYELAAQERERARLDKRTEMFAKAFLVCS